MPKITELQPHNSIDLASLFLMVKEGTGGIPATGKITAADLFESERYETLYLKCLGDNDSLKIANGVMYFVIPESLDGTKIVSVHGAVTVASTSGLPQARLYNISKTAYILSTNITIDANQYTSYTAVTQPVVNLSNNLVEKGNRMRVDIRQIGTGTKGFDMIIKVDKLWAL